MKIRITVLSFITALGITLTSAHSASAQTIGVETVTIPFNYDDNSPMIEIEVNGKSSRLIYDSGASGLALMDASFPELKAKTDKVIDFRVFGGNQNTDMEQIETVTLGWNGIKIDIKNPLLADYNKIIPDVNDSPYFEGILSPFRIHDGMRETITIFDSPNKNLQFLPLGQKENFEKAISFELTRKQGWEWQVKMPVILPAETEKRTLNFVVDTGAGPSLILNRKKLNLKNTSKGYQSKLGGIGGITKSAYAGRTTFLIGESKIRVDTNMLDSLPSDGDVDGYVGWGFLNRFRIAFDFNTGRMIIDLKDANLTDDKIRDDIFNIQGFPTSDWNGVHIIGVGRWASSGLQVGDILTSIDGIQLSQTAMYSVRREAQDAPNLCWIRDGAPETCGKVKASETEDK